MTTPAQIQANRMNAQKSTGPRTTEGKAAASQNALKHGLWAQNPIIQGEDPGQFETHRDQMLAELAPQGPLESTLADRVVGLAWRLKRAEHLQAQVFDALLAPDTSPLTKLARSLCPQNLRPPDDPAAVERALGHAVVKDFAGPQVLYRLSMVERRLEHSLYKTLAELQRLRLLRANGLAVLSAVEESPTESADPERDNPSRKTNPIAAGVLSGAQRSRMDLEDIPSPVQRIAPHTTTENTAHRHPKPDNAPSSLTTPRPFAIISPSAKAERRQRQVPDLQTAGPDTTRTGQDRNRPDGGPRPSRGRKLEGLRRP